MAIRTKPGPRTSGTIFSSPVIHGGVRLYRRPRIEFRVPRGEFRMSIAPCHVGEPEIQIRQCHTDREMTHGKAARAKVIVFQGVNTGAQFRSPQLLVRLALALGWTESLAQ